eukprot:scaffold90832_cov58-Phaeocystis_antarctica.AAC.1
MVCSARIVLANFVAYGPMRRRAAPLPMAQMAPNLPLRASWPTSRMVAPASTACTRMASHPFSPA